MTLNERRILKIIASAPLILIPLIIIITTILVINIYNDSLQKSILKLENNLIETEKKATQSKVDSISDLIVYQKSNESYIWIVDHNGYLQLGSANRYHMEGTPLLLDLKDTFSKSNEGLNKHFEQLAFVKTFGHYDWYFGTAEFFDTAIKQRDKKLLKSIEKIDGTLNSYTFILNRKGDMLLNPSRPELVGKNIFKLNAPVLQNNFQKIINTLQNTDYAFLSYVWINPTTQQKETKYTYVHTIANSDWIIGSSFYGTTIKNMLLKQTILMHEDYYTKFKYLILISLALLILALILSYFLSKYLKNSFQNYQSKINKVTNDLQVLNTNLEKTIQDRTKKLKETTDELQILAYHDALTGLPNRVLLSDRLEQAIQKEKRHKRGLALFFIDLDKFKEINDSLGHDVGDKMLKIVAKTLKNIIRKEDMLARLGGDEFTIIMEDFPQPQNALFLAKKILKEMKKPIYIDDYILYISCSIGISVYNTTIKNARNFLKYADTAMYKAKEKGSNNFQFYSSKMTEQAYQHMTMKTNLRKAINNEEFMIHYQPQIDGHSNKLVGIEALVRWDHPIVGVVSPAKFISLAEETGMIEEIDKWVMKTTMRQLSTWHKKGLLPGVLALNISIPQLENNDFLKELKENLKKYDFKAEWLELEITERQMMKEPEKVIKKLDQISNLGISISIDDFGTGYSSLSLLKRLPIHRLKIDQSFVNDIPNDSESATIIKTIIGLAKSLNLNLVAEGVETEEQKDFLLDNGCFTLQGYYYSKAMSTQKMQELLIKKRWH